jgi:hypothetical protein
VTVNVPSRPVDLMRGKRPGPVMPYISLRKRLATVARGVAFGTTQ